METREFINGFDEAIRFLATRVGAVQTVREVIPVMQRELKAMKAERRGK